MQTLQVNISYKQIFRIAIPISFAILIPQLNFFINTFFLAQIGQSELGVAGITGVYYLMFSSIGYGLNNGLQSLIARRAGENNPKAIGKLFSQGVILAMIIAAAGILITYTVLPLLLKSFLPNAEKIKMAIQYLQIRIWGLPFLYMFQMRNALLVGINQSKFLPIGTAMETIVNVILDYALIFGHFGLPALGFNGAAIASIIAEFIGMFVTYLIIKYKGIANQFSVLISFALDKITIRQIIKQSGPLVFQHAISILSWLLFFLLIGRMAEEKMNLAISNTMRNIFGLFGIVTWALGSTTNAMVSNVMGQGRPQDVWKVVKRIITISFSAALFFAIILNLFPYTIFHFFSEEVVFVEAAIPVIRVVSIAMIIMSISVVFLNAVIGTGNATYSLFIEICSIVFYVGFSFIMMEIFHIQLAIGWMNEWLYWGVILVLATLFLRKKFRNFIA